MKLHIKFNKKNAIELGTISRNMVIPGFSITCYVYDNSIKWLPITLKNFGNFTNRTSVR